MASPRPSTNDLEEAASNERCSSRAEAPVRPRDAAPDDDNHHPYWASLEHIYLGDSITLTSADGTSAQARHVPLSLPNGLTLTYGQITALAGDFYGTSQPISDGADHADQVARFTSAFDTLARDQTRQPWEAQAILALIQHTFAAPKKPSDDSSQGQEASGRITTAVTGKPHYPEMPLEATTFRRPSGSPGFLGLARINWDHFGESARVAYRAGHAAALKVARDGDLEGAYAMGAFADHFLEDSFSAGHLRTPRRELHGSLLNPAWDLCAKLMHDEESAIGLSVTNARGDAWTAYGDNRLFARANWRNRELCREAMQASAREIYEAWKEGPGEGVPPPAAGRAHAALELVPDLAAVRNDQALAALFVVGADGTLRRRRALLGRREHEYTEDWTALGTVVDAWWSASWRDPITLDPTP